MVGLCVFNGSGVSPEYCKRGLCRAGNRWDVKLCCEEVGFEVHPQVLVEAYTNALRPGAPEGVAVALLSTIAAVEKKLNIGLL